MHDQVNYQNIREINHFKLTFLISFCNPFPVYLQCSMSFMKLNTTYFLPKSMAFRTIVTNILAKCSFSTQICISVCQ